MPDSPPRCDECAHWVRSRRPRIDLYLASTATEIAGHDVGVCTNERSGPRQLRRGEADRSLPLYVRADASCEAFTRRAYPCGRRGY
jgi:hypothetical protein